LLPKDVPTYLPAGTVLRCNLPREDTRDVFVSSKYKSLADLPEGATIGSAALRRQSQLLAKYPTLKVRQSSHSSQAVAVKPALSLRYALSCSALMLL